MARTSELYCTETRALLGRLLDGELDAGERANVERHVASCPLCERELRSAERAFAALRDLPEEERARLRRDALRELGLDAEPSRRWARIVRALLVLAVFLLLVLWLRERHQRTPEAPRGVETR